MPLGVGGCGRDPARPPQAAAVTGDEELRELYLADQAERTDHPEVGTDRYEGLSERDAARRERLTELLAAGRVITAEDHFHAALLCQHGDELDDIALAYEHATRAVELGHGPARWLAAAAYDRWQMYQGLPQRYGTQIVPDGQRHRLWDVNPETTDADRAAWDVPPLAEMERRAAELAYPQPPMDLAPPWLRDAMMRWQREGS